MLSALLPFIIVAVLGTAASWVALRLPRYFIWLYILVYSRLFGFLQLDEVEIEGVLNLTLILHLGAIGAAVMRLAFGARLDANIKGMLAVIGVLFAYGIVAPTLRGDSDPMSSLIDGKDFLAYGFLAYLAVLRSEKTYRALVHALKISGFVLSVVALVSVTSGLAPPAYEPIEEVLGPRGGIHIYSSMFVFLAAILHLFYERWRWKKRRPLWYMVLAVYLSGLVVQGHRSVLFGFIFAVVMATVLGTNRRTVFKVGMLAATLTLALSMQLGGRLLDDLLVQPVLELIHGEGAILSRQSINEFRYELISRRMPLGYGFIDEKSSIGKDVAQAATSRFTQTFGTVDSGYVDLMIRFGVVGMAGFLGALAVFVFKEFRKKKKSPEAVPLLASIVSFYLIDITWSVFSYDFGIFSLCVAMCLIKFKNREMRERAVSAPA